MAMDPNDVTIDDVYIKDLKKHIDEYNAIEKQFDRIQEERKARARVIKNLLGFLKGAFGESKINELIDRNNLSKSAAKFMTIDDLVTAGQKTVVRRRKGTRVAQAVDPAAILAKGAKVKVLSGKYENWSGTVATSQARQGRNGLDVTYFLLLVGPKGIKKRTSVKHGTINKTWKAID